jgi:CubicO group peptidase (beta-lactamase class C family)
MSEAGCRRALEPQIEGVDLVLGLPARFGLGFGLDGELLPMKNRNSIFWGGYGGSLIIIDMDARTTFGYAMNKMGAGTVGDARSLDIINAIWVAS